MSNKITIEQIDAILPQTQCGLCDYGGCKPYAEAILNQGEAIDRCPPGGVKVLRKLAVLVKQELSAEMLADMEQKAKLPMQAKIREHECIGCTKCIQVCPTDAIVGTAKRMHTIIDSECTGCELCVPVCPIDCIDMLVIEPLTEPEQEKQSNYWRERFQMHEKRLAKQKDNRHLTHQKQQLNEQKPSEKNLLTKQAEIAAAIARVKAKKQK